MEKTIALMDGWLFTKPGQDTETINLPHTWNAVDGQDGGNDYWRGKCLYEKEFSFPLLDSETRRVYLKFEGVNACCDVILNGTRIMSHDGGYSTFQKDISDFLKADNLLQVEVDNGINDHVYPQKADFTFYGGIYRQVSLLIVNRNHFNLDYHGGCGLRITPVVKPDNLCRASVEVKSWTVGDGLVRLTLLDAADRIVGEAVGQNALIELKSPISGMALRIHISIPFVPGWSMRRAERYMMK